MRSEMRSPFGRALVCLLLVLCAHAGSFVQVTDVHIDFLYETGSSANCTDITECCHADSVPVGPETAGPEGSYFCDTPTWLANTTFEFAGTIRPIDFVLFTGDSPDHDMLEQTLEGNIRTFKEVARLLKTAFKDVPIYPVMGNHDTWPMDQVPPPPESDWLYQTFADDYKDYLSEESLKTFLYGGYYSELTPDGLRLVVVNCNYYDIFNAYVFMHECDEVQQKQFSWLETTLDSAKKMKEDVIIAAHIPPGHYGSSYDYDQKFINITDEYADIIKGMFFGHTHTAKIRVFHDRETGKIPRGVGYIAPSLTSFGFINPGVRAVHYDSTSHDLLDIDQYHCDLDDANEHKHPCVFKKKYSMREVYNLPDMRPASFEDLWLRLQGNDTLFSEYWKNQCTDYPGIKNCVDDIKCKWRVLCQYHYVHDEDQGKCYKEHDIIDVRPAPHWDPAVQEWRGRDVGVFQDPDNCL